ncbi:MAG: PIN domain-containing protein [Firmicutes bacterium]|nr:PIN domain-containing protein [Bacillota bacterium]
MEYISSDTNVWLDFATIDRLELPFKLPFTYLMNEEAAEDELLNPPGLGEDLVRHGLQKIELTEEEFYLAEEYVARYTKPSLYDCIALAVAKTRGITLLTGDGPLRKAAAAEGVEVMGTIGILDRLYDGNYIDEEEFHHCIGELMEHNGGKVRLPVAELKKRMK